MAATLHSGCKSNQHILHISVLWQAIETARRYCACCNDAMGMQPPSVCLPCADWHSASPHLGIQVHRCLPMAAKHFYPCQQGQTLLQLWIQACGVILWVWIPMLSCIPRRESEELDTIRAYCNTMFCLEEHYMQTKVAARTRSPARGSCSM